MSASLDIIVVNWNAGKHLRECLASIVSADKSGFTLARVVVVDNASSDGSLDRLEDLDQPLTIIRNAQNRGFAAACNQGAKGSQSDYLLFLNPDTCLFNDTLVRPINFMQQRGSSPVGICGVGLRDDFGVAAPSCARFPTLKIFFGEMTGLSRLLPHTFPSHLMHPHECRQSLEVDQVIGAFFLVRRSLFDSLNGFDERFFVYFEEVDFSLRAKQKGFSSYCLAHTLLYHKGGGCSGKIKAKRLFYSLRSRIQYAFKNYVFWQAVLLLVLTLTLELMARIFTAILLVSKSKLSETIVGYSQLVVYFIGRGWKWRS